MHIDFVLPEKGDIEKGLAAYRNKAALGCMDFAFHVAVTAWNKKVATDMARAVDQGINSFKFFLAYKVGFAVTCCHPSFRECSLIQPLVYFSSSST